MVFTIVGFAFEKYEKKQFIVPLLLLLGCRGEAPEPVSQKGNFLT